MAELQEDEADERDRKDFGGAAHGGFKQCATDDGAVDQDHEEENPHGPAGVHQPEESGKHARHHSADAVGTRVLPSTSRGGIPRHWPSSRSYRPSAPWDRAGPWPRGPWPRAGRSADRRMGKEL